MREYNWLTEREVSFHIVGAKGGLGFLNFWSKKNMRLFNSQYVLVSYTYWYVLMFFKERPSKEVSPVAGGLVWNVNNLQVSIDGYWQ